MEHPSGFFSKQTNKGLEKRWELRSKVALCCIIRDEQESQKKMNFTCDVIAALSTLGGTAGAEFEFHRQYFAAEQQKINEGRFRLQQVLSGLEHASDAQIEHFQAILDKEQLSLNRVLVLVRSNVFSQSKTPLKLEPAIDRYNWYAMARSNRIDKTVTKRQAWIKTV